MLRVSATMGIPSTVTAKLQAECKGTLELNLHGNVFVGSGDPLNYIELRGRLSDWLSAAAQTAAGGLLATYVPALLSKLKEKATEKATDLVLLVRMYSA